MGGRSIRSLVPQVEHALGLAFTSLERLWLNESDTNTEANGALDLMDQTLPELFHGSNGVGKDLWGHFDADFHLVEIVFPSEDDLVMG